MTSKTHYIIWVDDPKKYEWVRKRYFWSRRKSSKISVGRNAKVVGYVVQRDGPERATHYGHHYHRLVLIVTQNDIEGKTKQKPSGAINPIEFENELLLGALLS
jgi:hypothetical protein